MQCTCGYEIDSNIILIFLHTVIYLFINGIDLQRTSLFPRLHNEMKYDKRNVMQ